MTAGSLSEEFVLAFFTDFTGASIYQAPTWYPAYLLMAFGVICSCLVWLGSEVYLIIMKRELEELPSGINLCPGQQGQDGGDCSRDICVLTVFA